MSESDLFKRGLKLRRRVLGPAYVDASLAKADDFMMTFQRVTTEWCWGYTWTPRGPRPQNPLDAELGDAHRPVQTRRAETPRQRRADQRRYRRGDQRNPAPRHDLLRYTVGLEAFKTAHEVLIAEGAIPAPAT